MPTLTAQREQVFESFRRWGYLAADLDPLGLLRRPAVPELEGDTEEHQSARGFYCGTVGVEFAHILDPVRRRWIQERMEAAPPAPDRQRLLERVSSAEIFEQFIQARYPGAKRFSLEGSTALIPFLDEVLETAAGSGCEHVLIGMSHRGRLNVILHTVGRQAAEIFAGFEDVDPRSVLGAGDVKYHRGATGEFRARNGREMHVHLVSNPSHLEFVDPVVAGRAYAKQVRGGAEGKRQVLPIAVHGDGAFAGQGILAETLNLGALRAYSVGGTIHVIVNNLIAFTTLPEDLQSSAFASDVARRAPVPVFHVNGEDLDAVARVAHLAAEYRAAFSSDVVVDLVGYRRHGHSEVDDPTITQPVLYRRIKEHPELWRIYAERSGLDPEPVVARVREALSAQQKEAVKFAKIPTMRKLPGYWAPFFGGRYKPEYEVPTPVAPEELRAVGELLARYPPGFHVHPKVKKLLEQRLEMSRGERPVDYGMAEAMAFATLLRQGVPLRLTGQDTRRGTFNQRHASLVDTETEQEHVPLEHIGTGETWCQIFNSPLSEAAVLGFEYGVSRDYPEALVLWEAQFGDFANGAQVVIDQFIAAGEDKWGLLSGLVMLLPHGYEGQGPEHSSARIERFLHLAARDNFQICQPSDAAQYFHLLRRQALRKWRKPLVVFTPKSMLRHPDASSPIEAFSRAHFRPVLRDPEVANADRILLCTGKIGHELRAERKRRGDAGTAIFFLDQMYPFPEQDLAEALAQHPKAHEIVWVQEEPANMGALFFVLPRLERMARGIAVRSVKRSASATPATGSAKAHHMEQQTILALAFTTGQH
ncbi:MAG TPA: 2-oxoglutarate dehydrogenase E1 component [Candidatus Acidoferrales bacterium]|nr:2-oxoglutarate dehydrogenase E1 component [Candidatus Acidoferrales bacterium]